MGKNREEMKACHAYGHFICAVLTAVVAQGWPGEIPPLDEDLLPKPTRYFDPEANWSAQQESGVKETSS